ncbi:MAG: methionyl-tRNA formyltransferase [Clostridia bacterium]|nr:methionyl-tRNA formyltransferase [Clostridia bacterium]
MKVAFCGTPEFALPSLDMLIARGFDICVFTQPDRPKARSKRAVPPPVKIRAAAHGLPVYQFEKIRSPEGVAALSGFAPDLMVTAAFGQILSRQNLEIPKLGCINVHGSLLPKYRGASPVQSAVINGEHTTGITTMLTDVGLDTGDILLSREVSIDPEETAGELYARLASVGAEVLSDTIDALLAGSLTRTPQDHSAATKCGLITRERARIDFGASTRSIHNLVRGMNPAPVAWAAVCGEVIKVFRTAPRPDAVLERAKSAPGTVLAADHRAGLLVATGDGVIELLEIQTAGSKRMSAKAFFNGRRLQGDRFDEC